MIQHHRARALRGGRAAEVAIRRAVADLIALARRHPATLPILREQVPDDRLFVHVRNEQEQRRVGPGIATIVAVVTSLDMSIFHPQIEFSGGLYVSEYQGDLFVNQLAGIRRERSSNATFARRQVWLEWSARSRCYRLRRSGASLALLDRVFGDKSELDIYRVGYPEEPALFADLARLRTRRRAIRELLPHLDRGTVDNPSFYGDGRVHGYYFTSDPARVRYHLKKGGGCLYQVRVERTELEKLIREDKLFVALEWVDEINFFSIDALTYLGARLSASSLRPSASAP